MLFVLFFSCLLLLFSFYKQIYFEHKISIEKNKEKKKKYCVLLDFLRLPGAMIVTDHLLQEPIQRRIDANTIRIKSYFKWHHKIKWNPFNPRSFHHWVFFEHGFIGFNGCLLRYRYCLPDSFTWCTNNPETSSRVTLALLGIVVQTKVTLSWSVAKFLNDSLRSVLSSRQRWWRWRIDSTSCDYC